MIAPAASRTIILTVTMLLVSCAPWQSPDPVTPVSYQTSRDRMERTVGKLRRLAVIELDQDAPSACVKTLDEQARLVEVDSVVATVLTERKGYEVVAPDPERHAELRVGADGTPLVQELLAAGAQTQTAIGGPVTRDLLQRLREQDRVDGLLVLYARRTCQNALPGFRQFMIVGTLGLSELMVDPKLLAQETGYSAFVFETEAARVVWRNKYGALAQGWDAYVSSGKTDRDAMSPVGRLIDAIEPAVPKLLVR